MSASEPRTDERLRRAQPTASDHGTDAPADLRWAERLVRFMDDGLRVPGTSIRFGADALIGAVLPGAGDWGTAVVGFGIVVSAIRRGAKLSLVWRMVMHLGIDFLLGVVPLVGDVFDVAFKANRRNLELLKAHALAVSEGQPRRSRFADVALIALVATTLAALVALPMLLVFWLWGVLSAAFAGT